MKIDLSAFDKFVKYEDAIYGINPFDELYLIACYEETEDYWIGYVNPIKQEESNLSGDPIDRDEVAEILNNNNVEWDDGDDEWEDEEWDDEED